MTSCGVFPGVYTHRWRHKTTFDFKPPVPLYWRISRATRRSWDFIREIKTNSDGWRTLTIWFQRRWKLQQKIYTVMSRTWATIELLVVLATFFYTSVQHVCMMTYSLRNYVFLLAKYLYTFYITFPRGCWCVCQCFCRRRSTLQVWRWLLYWRTLGQHIAGNWQVVDICAASLPHVLHSRTWWRPDEPMAVGGSPATWSSKHMHEDVGHYHCYFDKLTLVRCHWTFSTEIGWNGNSSTWFSHLAVQFQLR